MVAPTPHRPARKVEDTPGNNDRHHLASEDDLDNAVRGNLKPGVETAHVRALLSLSLSAMRLADANELANDLAALRIPDLLDEDEKATVRQRARKRLGLD